MLISERKYLSSINIQILWFYIINDLVILLLLIYMFITNAYKKYISNFLA